MARPEWFALVLLACLAPNIAAKCVMRSVCDPEETKVPCVYNGEPQTLSKEESRTNLVNLCGDVFPDPYGAVCCSDDQLQDLAEQMESAIVLGLNNCPACGTNFRNLFCAMLCSPDQHEFIELVHTDAGEDGKDFVRELNYHLAREYVQGLFNSCVNAKSRIPSVNLLNFLCGKWGSECTADRWLEFLGASPEHGGLSPMQTNYIQADTDKVAGINGTEYSPMHIEPYKCNTDDTTKACSCQHCHEACPVENPAAVDDKKE